MSTISPFLWFDHQAEEAANFYISIFKESKIIDIKKKDDKVIATTFVLNGQEFIALNGGPEFKFTHAISFYVRCKDQAEIDYYWDALSAGGKPVHCGWLTDKYGLSWQIVPESLEELLWNKDSEKKDAVWNALMQMVKLDIEGLKRAGDLA